MARDQFLLIDPPIIESAIQRLLAGRASDSTLSATELAQELSPDPEWHRLLPLVRRVAIDLALAGRLVIYRKGKPVDPTNFKGVWRMGLPRHD